MKERSDYPLMSGPLSPGACSVDDRPGPTTGTVRPMYTFLSDEWMAATREIRARFEEQLPPVTTSIRINQVITDVPFGEGTINAYIDTSSGSLVFELGELDEPDAVMMTDYETARALLVDRDPAIAMQSFMAGKIRVQGDMMKLMAMQTAVPPNEFSEQVADEIAAITSMTGTGGCERLHRARAGHVERPPRRMLDRLARQRPRLEPAHGATLHVERLTR